MEPADQDRLAAIEATLTRHTEMLSKLVRVLDRFAPLLERFARLPGSRSVSSIYKWPGGSRG